MGRVYIISTGVCSDGDDDFFFSVLWVYKPRAVRSFFIDKQVKFVGALKLIGDSG